MIFDTSTGGHSFPIPALVANVALQSLHQECIDGSGFKAFELQHAGPVPYDLEQQLDLQEEWYDQVMDTETKIKDDIVWVDGIAAKASDLHNARELDMQWNRSQKVWSEVPIGERRRLQGRSPFTIK